MFELYRFYFRKLCELHPMLLHTEERKVFRVIHIEEAFGDLRTEVAEKGFIFRLIYPTYGFGDQGSDARRKSQCGFLLAKHSDNRFKGEEGNVLALDDCRKVADDFVVKMISDSRLGYPLFGRGVNKAEDLDWNAQPLPQTGDGTYAGLLCTFRLEEYLSICLEDHPDAGWQLPTPEPSSFWLTADSSFLLTADGSKFLLS